MTKITPAAKWLVLILLVGAAAAATFYCDTPVRAFVAAHRDRSFIQFMRLVSRFGDWPEHVAAGLLIAAIAFSCGSQRWMRIGLTIIVALALAGVVARCLKIATARARPTVHREMISEVSRFRSKYNSFPSGHAAVTMAAFGVILFTKRRLGILLLPVPILIASSRIFVAAHYFSDVICGAILGIFCAWLCAHWLFAREN
ncbi:MAG TPA: phosphatase PAP2 family protein [Chthoniobacterales bacterium]|jgi:undecaprenyl-diphosphatase